MRQRIMKQRLLLILKYLGSVIPSEKTLHPKKLDFERHQKTPLAALKACFPGKSQTPTKPESSTPKSEALNSKPPCLKLKTL